MQMLCLLRNSDRSATTATASEQSLKWKTVTEWASPEMMLASYRYRLARLPANSEERADLLDGFSTMVLLFGLEDHFEEADRASAKLYSLKPHEWTVLGTRGSILVELGRYDEGVAMVQQVWKNDLVTFDLALAASND
jgi:hypothetical protein